MKQSEQTSCHLTERREVVAALERHAGPLTVWKGIMFKTLYSSRPTERLY